MNKSLQLHWNALQFSGNSLLKGKFLLFFIPGGIISVFYLMYYLQSLQLHEGASSLEEVPLIGSAITWVANNSLSVLDLIIREFYKFTILVVLSPVFCVLSERVDTAITGKTYTFSWVRIINDILRMILIVTIALTLEFILMLFFWILSFLLPDIITDSFFFLTSAFFLGFSFYDYSLERYGVGTGASWLFGFGKFATVLISGMIFSLLYMIPIIGILIAPVITTIITTFVYIKMQDSTLVKH